MKPKKHVELYKSGKGYRWRLVAANGEIISSGESYTRKYGAKQGAMRACPGVEIVDKTKGKK